jgi:hypothetical protein
VYIFSSLFSSAGKSINIMEAFNISLWPEDVRPAWFDLVVARVACPQACKTTDEAQKWESTAKEGVKSDPYAVSTRFINIWPWADLLHRLGI